MCCSSLLHKEMQQRQAKRGPANARKAVLAESAVLESAQVQVLAHSETEGSVVEFRGWRIKTTHGPIMDERQLAELSATISSRVPSSAPGDDSIVMNNVNMHFPEMIFGQDQLTLTDISSGLEINFNATDCLFLWANAHLGEVEVVKVPQAWSRPQTTERHGDDNLHVMEYDWTFTTDYCLTLQKQDGTRHIVGAIDCDTAKQQAACIEALEHSGIDVDMLKAREPILFYDEVSLFRDDLHDHGEVTCDVKVRVMPRCWFVLHRYFLRVDGCCVKIRETRVFHELGSDKVCVDVSYRDVGPARLAELAIPAAALRDVNTMAQRLPVDNSNLKVPGSFCIPVGAAVPSTSEQQS